MPHSRRWLLPMLCISWLGWAPPGRADSSEAFCLLSRHDHTIPVETGSCSFSQRQGHVTVLMNQRWAFSFSADQQGTTYQRSNNSDGIRFNREGQYSLQVLWRRPLHCQSDQKDRVSVVFFGNGSSASVDLAIGDQHVLLPLARSASGARYSNGPVELWEHQGTTRIDWFGDILRCTQSSDQVSAAGTDAPEALSGRQEHLVIAPIAIRTDHQHPTKSHQQHSIGILRVITGPIGG